MLKGKLASITLATAIAASLPMIAEAKNFEFDKDLSSAKVTEKGGKKTLTVTASMEVPTTGYKAKLVKSSKTGIPETRYLEYKLTVPTGMTHQTVSHVTATYEEKDFKGGINKVNVEEASHKQTLDLNVEGI